MSGFDDKLVWTNVRGVGDDVDKLRGQVHMLEERVYVLEDELREMRSVNDGMFDGLRKADYRMTMLFCVLAVVLLAHVFLAVTI